VSDLRVIDLFAGCGGWDVGARALGVEPLGIELDHAACETRRAAGDKLETLRRKAVLRALLGRPR
jgi:site-specific DNA-cytosine methylase